MLESLEVEVLFAFPTPFESASIHGTPFESAPIYGALAPKDNPTRTEPFTPKAFQRVGNDDHLVLELQVIGLDDLAGVSLEDALHNPHLIPDLEFTFQ